MLPIAEVSEKDPRGGCYLQTKGKKASRGVSLACTLSGFRLLSRGKSIFADRWVFGSMVKMLLAWSASHTGVPGSSLRSVSDSSCALYIPWEAALMAQVAVAHVA